MEENKDMEQEEVIKKVECPDCGNTFMVPQKSIRAYCDNCMLKRVQAGKKLPPTRRLGWH